MTLHKVTFEAGFSTCVSARDSEFEAPSMNPLRPILALAFAGFLAVSWMGSSFAEERFSVSHAVGMTEFIYPAIGLSGEPLFSPDRKYVVFTTARGVAERNVIEYTIWLWRTEEIERAINVERAQAPEAVKLVTLASRRSRHVISDIRWLLDSSAIVYRGEVGAGEYQLFKADVRSQQIARISAADQDVGEFGRFDIRGGRAIYAVLSPSIKTSIDDQQQQSAFNGT